MPDFRGARVALLEARFSEDAANMVRRLGGHPISAPALREVPRDIPQLCNGFVPSLARAPQPVVVCLTGAGVRALFAQAVEQGCEPALGEALARATTVCRGPKPAGVLASRGLPVSLRAAEPFTTTELIAVMEPLDLSGRFVALLHYGELNTTLSTWLRERGADVHELLPYEWQLPKDLAPIDDLVHRLLTGGVDVLVFTSQVQVRHLFEVAGVDRAAALIERMNDATITGAIGPTCAAALEAVGVRPAFVASPPKLAPLLNGLAELCEKRPRAEG
jgi:uroporphyrinogen-III synthase